MEIARNEKCKDWKMQGNASDNYPIYNYAHTTELH